MVWRRTLKGLCQEQKTFKEYIVKFDHIKIRTSVHQRSVVKKMKAIQNIQ